MATIHSTGTHLPVEVSKTLGTLAEFPATWQVFVGWPNLDAMKPDLLVVGPEGHLFFVSSSGAANEVLDAFDASHSPPSSASLPERRLYRAVESLRTSNLAGLSAQSLLILTNASVQDLAFTFMRQLPPEIACVSKANLDVDLLKRLATRTPPQPDIFQRARAHVAAASTIRPELTAERNTPKVRRLRFLDPLQEEWLRHQLCPPTDVEHFSSNTVTGHYLLTGPAGCGKTLLLLYRAMLESKLHPDSRPLVLTHNKPLLADLRVKSAVLAKQFGTQPFITEQILSWCRRWVDRWPDAVAYKIRDEYVRAAIGSGASPEQVRFHAQEFAYIQDHIVVSLNDYETFRRAGRSRPLQPDQRVAVWEKLQRFLSLLKRDNVTDFPTLGLSLYQRVVAGELVPTPHQIILVDEAQFLPPTLIGILKHTVGPEGTLILAADPTQGFLQRRSPWTRVDLNFSRRTTKLKQPYRGTRSILQFARAFYLSRTTDATDTELNLPGEVELAKATEGPWPDIVIVDRRQDEERAVANAVRELISGGVQPSNILVVTGEPGGASSILGFLQAASRAATLRWTATMAKEASGVDQVRVCTLDTATGLEAPYVVIAGSRALFEAEQDPTLQGERSQIEEDNTRRFYMAFTRAGFRLLVFWSGGANHPFPQKNGAVLSYRPTTRASDCPHEQNYNHLK